MSCWQKMTVMQTFVFRFLLGCAVLGIALLRGADAVAADRLSWPCRTGPTLDSHVDPADAAGLPTEWSEADHKGILWKLSLEGRGHSAPIIGHGKIWLTAATEDGTQQFIYAIDPTSGQVLHHRLLWTNESPEPLGNEINTYASPSCALDADGVYVHFGTYGTARLDPETTQVVWERRDIACRHFRGPGSSPILFGKLLLLTFDGIDQQFLMALDTQTGKTVWRTDRTTDYGDLDPNGKPIRDGDNRKAYGTPGLTEVNGRTQLVSVGSRAGFGYDAETGQELWTFTHNDFNASAPPVFYRNFAIVNTGSRGANLLAIRLDESTRGNIDNTHVVWNRDKGNSDLAGPLVVADRVYMITNTGVAACLNAETGEEIWKGRVDGTYTASPITANGLIYFCNEEGDTTVVRAQDTFEIVSRNRLAEGMRASPSAANGRLYLRTFSHLYCIGNPAAP
ncbi:MAG: PQQ-like beta-propeller repeat protein [Planctomycetaceae bacterium]|nr:PQQ-like beta-propeller repeat protein [Planctomycetaceae bacterium]